MFEKPFVTISDPVYLPYTICIPETLEEEKSGYSYQSVFVDEGRWEGGREEGELPALSHE